MATADPRLYQKNKTIQDKLKLISDDYLLKLDLRWMFAHAHYLITRQINENMTLFRDPNHIILLNLHFASVYVRAAKGVASAPWNRAYHQCLAAGSPGRTIQTILCKNIVAEWYLDPHSRACYTPTNDAVISCSIAMANAHINIDLRNALSEVGCGDPHDYGNVLLFVNRASETTLTMLLGDNRGELFTALKEWFLPLDKIWRNQVYQSVCSMDVPDVEARFLEKANALVNSVN